MKAQLNTAAKSSGITPSAQAPAFPGLLQRKCACGGAAGALTGECSECVNERRLQTKLRIGSIDDPSEHEADRVAEEILAAPPETGRDSAPLRIARYATGHSKAAVPAGVDEVLAGAGSSLDASLRQDMEQRFGHDFSRVRIHHGPVAERSAEELNAQAYTVGHDIVFGAGRLAPASREGRRLIAHELTHVVQQKGAAALQRAPKSGAGSSGVTISAIDIKSTDPDCQYQEGEAEKSRSPQGLLANDIERAEFFGMEPADAVVIADFKVDDGALRPATESLFRKYWLPTFDKAALSSLEVLGFNDCVGWESRNLQLRQQRAQAVARLLPGISANAAPFGEYPAANSSERGRALNRAVMIRPKIKPPPPPPPPRKHEATVTTQEPDTKNCTTDQRRQLSIAFPAARLMAERALKEISSGNRGPVFTLLLERYFGPDALSHLPEIRAGYAKILNNWTDWDKRFDCETQTEGSCPNDDPHMVTLAYIKKKRRIFSPNQAFGTVHVCAEAFNTPGDMQQLSATVLHELSHRLDNTSDKKYCEDHVGWCGALSTRAAIDNADSYARFAREIFNARL